MPVESYRSLAVYVLECVCLKVCTECKRAH